MNLTFKNKFGLPPLVCLGFEDICSAYGGSQGIENPHFNYGQGYVPNLPANYGQGNNNGYGNTNGNTTTTIITTANVNGQNVPIIVNANPDLLTQLRSMIMANQGISLGFAVLLGYLILKK